jgi:hypothetical protein
MAEEIHPGSGEKVSFTAKNIFSGDGNLHGEASLSVAPDASDPAKKGAAGILLSLVQHTCVYEDFSIDGVRVTGSVVTGLRTSFPDGGWTGEGYEWGCLVNGDRYLAEIFEKGDAKSTEGKLKMIQGTGSLVGITGEGTYSNSPKPGDKTIVSVLTGWYRLPAAESDGAAA